MSTYQNKVQSNINQESTERSGEQKSDLTNFNISDNRPEAIAQKKLIDSSNNNDQSKQIKQFQTGEGTNSPTQQSIQKIKNNTGLPDNLKSGVENLSGYSLDDVKVHYNSDKPAQLQAHAYAQGTDIHVASGQEKHLPHEAWHVVQQKQGRVRPTLQMKSNIPVNDDAGLEKEADEMGAKAVSSSAVETRNELKNIQLKSIQPIQRETVIEYDSQEFDVRNKEGEYQVTEEIGGKMTAQLDPDDPIKGTITNGKEIPSIMNYLNTMYPNRKAGWHRGHLLNAKLGGLNIPINLSPIPNSMNTGAHSLAEEVVKRMMGIGVPCLYIVTYSIEEGDDQDQVNILLNVKLDPKPRNEEEEHELNGRGRAGLEGMDVDMKATILSSEDDDRPSSPQPSLLYAQDERPLVSGEKHSGFQDQRIASRGWGILKNSKGKDVALTPEEQESISMHLLDNDDMLTSSNILDSETYLERVTTDMGYYVDLAIAWANENLGDGVGDLLLEGFNNDIELHEEAEFDKQLKILEKAAPNHYKALIDYYGDEDEEDF